MRAVGTLYYTKLVFICRINIKMEYMRHLRVKLVLNTSTKLLVKKRKNEMHLSGLNDV